MRVADASSKSTPPKPPSSPPASSKGQTSPKSAPSGSTQSSSAPSKPASSSSGSPPAQANKDRMAEPSKAPPVNLSGAPAKPALKPPSDASAAQVSRLGAGDQVKYKTAASAKAGQASAQAESSVSVKKNDSGQYEVSADRGAATAAGLNVPPQPSAPRPTSASTAPAAPERPGQPRGPIIDTTPKPEQKPGQIALPRPGGIVSIPGGPSIVTQPGGVGVGSQPGSRPAPGGGPLLEGPLLGRPSTSTAQGASQRPASSSEDKGPDVEIGAKTGNTVTYTVGTPQEAARASEILMGGKVASPGEAAALNDALTSQEVKYSSTAKASGNGLTAEEAGTTAFKVNYQQGRVTGTELRSEFEVSGDATLHGVGVKAGDKLSFTTINSGGATRYESAAELSGVAKAPGAGFLTGVGGAKTEYKFSQQGTEVSSFLTSQQGANVPLGPGSLEATVELEDRVYHSAPADNAGVP